MILTESDRNRLRALINMQRGPLALGTARLDLHKGLTTATIVDSTQVPSSVVTMNSTVSMIDMANGRIITYALVYPTDADIDNGRISVLTPLGAALLGRAERDVIEVSVPAGVRRFYIQKVLYQPESVLREREHPPGAA
jgi:regulator of nucleoside diphosphate kinase